MSAETELRRARAAQQLIADPLIAEAFAAVDAIYTKAWRESPARDTEGRERLYAYVKALSDFRAHFEALIQGGDLARAEIETRVTGRSPQP